MTLEDYYIYAFLFLLVFVVLWSVVMRIAEINSSSPQTYKYQCPSMPMDTVDEQAALDDLESPRQLDQHIDSLISKWEQSRRNA